MNYVSNSEITDFLTRLKHTCDADVHGGMLAFAQKAMVERGFFEAAPKRVDPLAPFPTDWRALQTSIYDNGAPAPPKRKRGKLPRSTTRYGLSMRAWTRAEIDFSRATQIAWQANAYLWDHASAVRIVEEIATDRMTDQATVDLMRDTVEGLGADWLFAIPVNKVAGLGTHWHKRHIIALDMSTGQPGDLAFMTPGTQHFISETKWADVQSNGKPFKPNTKTGSTCIAQAREANLGCEALLAPWIS